MLKKIAVIVLLGPLLTLVPAVGLVANADEASVALGKKVAFDRRKGNCVSCHVMDNGTLPGNQGPPLVVMEARFPDREVLKAQISNPLEKNVNSIMPPFGLHNIISEKEIDAIVDYLLTL